MKKPYKILLIIAVALLFLGIVKDYLIKTTVEIAASKVLGTSVHIQGMSVGVLKQTIRIVGLKVDQPSGFPPGTMIDIPNVGVDYDLGAILKGTLHLPKLVLDLKELVVVTNKEGKLNVDALKVAQKPSGGTDGAKSIDKAQKEMPIQIDVAELNLGKVIVKDYSKIPYLVTAYDIGVRHKTYRNIKSAQQLVALVMVESMKPTAIKNAAIYGVATMMGIAFLPAVVVENLLHKFQK